MVDAILSQFNVQLVIVKGVRCAYCYKHDPEDQLPPSRRPAPLMLHEDPIESSLAED